MTSNFGSGVLGASAHRGFAGEGILSPALLAGSTPVPDAFPLTPEDQVEDQDADDLPTGVDEDELNYDDLDTDQITSPD